VVDAVSRGSNAFAAGLRLSDVVRKFDGVTVNTQNHFLTLVSRLPSGRRVTLSVEREREDKKGVHKVELTFRLEPLWSGPPSGKWVPDAKLVEAETRAILEAHRATHPPAEWVRTESVQLAGGMKEQRVTRVRGHMVRLERGPVGAQSVEVYDGGRGWAQRPDGTLEDLPAVRRDELAGTANALVGLSTSAGEAKLKSIAFTGGESIDGELVYRIETRDVAGRRRKLYVSPTSHALVGLAYPVGGDRWVEVVFRTKAGTLRRVHDHDGAEIERVTFVGVKHESQDAALFKKPSGQ
jgi:hypothetical protein